MALLTASTVGVVKATVELLALISARGLSGDGGIQTVETEEVARRNGVGAAGGSHDFGGETGSRTRRYL